MNKEITKELKEMITHEVLYRYDNLESAEDSAKTLINEIEREFSQQKKEIIEKIEKKQKKVRQGDISFLVDTNYNNALDRIINLIKEQ